MKPKLAHFSGNRWIVVAVVAAVAVALALAGSRNPALQLDDIRNYHGTGRTPGVPMKSPYVVRFADKVSSGTGAPPTGARKM